MSKYSLEFKLKVVEEYLGGKSGGLRSVANDNKIPFETLKNWIFSFNAYGVEGLKKKIMNNKYTGEFKLSVIKYRQINNLSYREAAEHFNLPNGAMVTSWAKKYQEEGFSGLNKIQGRPRKDMSNNKKNISNKPLNETEREELIRLREENEHFRLKEIYEKKLEAYLLEKELKTKRRQK